MLSLTSMLLVCLKMSAKMVLQTAKNPGASTEANCRPRIRNPFKKYRAKVDKSQATCSPAVARYLGLVHLKKLICCL